MLLRQNGICERFNFHENRYKFTTPFDQILQIILAWTDFVKWSAIKTTGPSMWKGHFYFPTNHLGRLTQSNANPFRKHCLSSVQAKKIYS